MVKLLLTFVVAIGIAAAGGVAIYKLFPDWPTRGQFGDMFGSINALFSVLAFIGVIVTIWMQREELSLQRNELAMTREELKRSTAAQQESATSLAKQLEQQIFAARIEGLVAILNSIDSETATATTELKDARSSTEKEQSGTYLSLLKKFRSKLRVRISDRLVSLGESSITQEET